MDHSLQSRVQKQLETGPERPAIAFYDDQGNFSWLSREQFYGIASGYAAQLARLGLHEGAVCVLVLPSEELTTHLLTAILMLGGIPLLVAPPLLQGEEAHSSLQAILEHIIQKTRPRVVVCPEEMAGRRAVLEAVHPETRVVTERHFYGQSPSNISIVHPDSQAIGAMQLTSGTTGFPRICVWRQENMLAALDGMVAAMQLTDEDVCLNWTPLYHDMGLVNNFLLCLTSGIPLVMVQPHDFVRKPALWLRGLHDTGTTVTWSPNFGFAISAQRIRDRDLEAVRIDHVRAFWNAAERIHHETMLAFQERLRPYGLRETALKTNFGCAENVGGATFSDPEGTFNVEHVDRDILLTDRVAVPVDPPRDGQSTMTIVGCGRPYPGMKIDILSEEGEPLPEGRVGEIALNTPSRMEGYLDNPEANERAFHGESVVPGDLGYMRDGELFWVGRSRERIAVRGKKLDPSDFEPILLTVPGLRHGSFAVFGVDDTRQGTQRIVVVAEVRDHDSRDLEAISGDIRGQVLNRLGVNISEILLVPPRTLTKTSSGKRRHRFFRQLYEQGKLKDYALEQQTTR